MSEKMWRVEWQASFKFWLVLAEEQHGIAVPPTPVVPLTDCASDLLMGKGAKTGGC